MIKIINIEDVTVVKNITEEEYSENLFDIENIVNGLIIELLDEKAFIDIDNRTLIRVVREDNDLIVSIDDMYFKRYFKEQRFEGWF